MMKARRSILDIVEARWAFSVEDARRVIDAVGKPPKLDPTDYPDVITRGDDPEAAALAWHLNNTAFDLRSTERRQSMPPPKAVAKRASEIASLCEQLLSKAQDSDGTLFDGLGPGALYAFAAAEIRNSGTEQIEDENEGAVAVAHALAEVARLGCWSKGLATRAAQQAALKPSRPGRKVDEAWHKLIERLSGVYFYLWQERPGLSRHPETARPGGPYFRFVQAVVDHLLPRTKTAEAIATALGDHRWRKWEELQ